jgi:hypothetical protein
MPYYKVFNFISKWDMRSRIRPQSLKDYQVSFQLKIMIFLGKFKVSLRGFSGFAANSVFFVDDISLIPLNCQVNENKPKYSKILPVNI